MVTRHRSYRQSHSKRDFSEVPSLREQADLLPFGPVRDAALKKARQAETAAQIDAWLTAPASHREKMTTPTAQIAAGQCAVS
jgi:hypothetical protein